MKRVVFVAALIVSSIAAGAGGTFAALGNRPDKGEVARLEATARERGHTEGYQEGQAAGFQEGESVGFQRGEDAGFQQGHAEGRSEGYDSGYEEGYSAGYMKGQVDLRPFLQQNQDAYEEGWQDGYEVGCEAGGGNINVLGECLEPFTLPLPPDFP